jgi:CRISPR-associated protein Cas5t
LNKKIGISRAPAVIELLVDVNLTVHIKVHDETRFDEVLEKLKNPQEYISLGRREDLALIEEARTVTVRKIELDRNDVPLKNNFYVPLEFKESGSVIGTIYDLNVTYTVDKNFRKWKKQRVFYAPKNSTRFYAGESIQVDDDDDFVFFITGEAEA